MPETTQQHDEIRALQLTVAVYAVVIALKLAAYLATGVMALLAEGLHTLSDIFVSAFLLIAALWSRRRPDSVHMYGYARAQNVAALVAATLFISFTSYKLYEESLPRLFSGEVPVYQNLPVAIGVLVLSMVIAAAPLISLARQKTHGAAAKAQLVELINDQLGLLAALIGTVLTMLGWHLADPLAAIVVATIIAVNGINLFRENLSFLIGRAPEREYLQRVETVADDVPGVLGIHDLRAEYVGPETVHVDFHIAVARGTPIEEADRIAEEAMERVRVITGCTYCTIHVDPVPLPSALEADLPVS